MTTKSLRVTTGILLMLGFMLPFTVQAQYFHLNEDFETFFGSPLPFKGWSNDINQSNSGQDLWRFDNPSGRTVSSPGSGNVAIFDAGSYSNDGLPEDVNFVSPNIDTRGYSNVWLKFANQFQVGSSTNNWAVEVFDGATWTTIANGSAQINWRTDSFDISTYCANKEAARVRFHWRGNGAFYWMIDNVKVYSTVVADNLAGIDARFKGNQCGNSNDSLRFFVRNVGANTVSNIPVQADITGTLNGSPVNLTLTTTYTGSLAPGQIADIRLGPVNTLQGGIVNSISYAKFGTDPNRANDTFKIPVYDVFGTPPLPTPTNGTRCGAGTVTLSGGVISGYSALWYSSPGATTPMATGPSFTTPLLSPPSTVTYYISQGKFSTGKFLSSVGATGTTLPTTGMWWFGAGVSSGNMFDVTAKSTVLIDSIATHIWNTRNVDISIYYKTGTYQGFQFSPGSWTLLATVPVKARGAGNATFVKLPTPFTIAPGQKVAFYVRSSEEQVFEYGTNTVINSDLTIEMGDAITGLFSGSLISYTWSGNLYYRIYCESNKVPISATANPTPQGSFFFAGSPFTGKLNSGTLANPDIVSPPDAITFEIQPPTGPTFTNANYGSSGTWVFTSVNVTTISGVTVPPALYTLTNPSTGGNGKIQLMPTVAYIDSAIKISYVIKRNDYGCDTLIERIVFIAPRPKAGFNLPSVCAGETFEFDNTSAIQSGSMTFEWDFGDGTKSNSAAPNKKYTLAGVYTVKLVVTSNYGYKDSITQNITIKEIPVPHILITNACEGTALSFKDNSVLPPGTATYEWQFGDGNTSAVANPTHLYTSPNIYKIDFKVTVSGCSASIQRYATQAPRSKPNFSYTTNCDKALIPFTSTGINPAFGGVSYTWDFGDLTGATGNSLMHEYNAFGVYKVVLTGRTEMGCIDTVSKTITLRESPKANFTTGGIYCSNQEISYTNASTTPASSTNNYIWSFGDLNDTTGTNVTHLYSTEGTYKVTLTANSSNGCSGTIEKPVVIEATPVANFSAGDVCAGNPTEFANSTTITNGTVTYHWNFGNTAADTSALQSPSFTYPGQGTYVVTLDVSTPAGCNSSTQRNVQVYAVPAVNINMASAQTGDGTMLFNTDATGVTYNWTFGDGGSATIKNPSYQYSFPGLWTVKLVVTSPNGCKNSTTDVARVNTLSVKNMDATGNWSVYPNPGTGVYTIQYAGTGEIKSVIVTDITGRQVWAAENINAAKSGFDITTQNAGIYMVLLTDSLGNSYVQKITLVK